MSQTENKLEKAYVRMLEGIQESLGKAKKEGRSLEHWFRHAADVVVEKEIEWEALTREEALRVSQFIARDLQHASDFMKQAGEELKFAYDVDKVYAEDRFIQAFRNAADPTEMGQFALSQKLHGMFEYHAGEVTAMGTLLCQNCGESLSFRQPGKIPPCEHCKGTVYVRGENDSSSGGQ